MLRGPPPLWNPASACFRLDPDDLALMESGLNIAYLIELLHKKIVCNMLHSEFDTKGPSSSSSPHSLDQGAEFSPCSLLQLVFNRKSASCTQPTPPRVYEKLDPLWRLIDDRGGA